MANLWNVNKTKGGGHISKHQERILLIAIITVTILVTSCTLWHYINETNERINNTNEALKQTQNELNKQHDESEGV